jgi:hypothetical protein
MNAPEPKRRQREFKFVDAKQAVDLATAQPENVFLFAPNLIGKLLSLSRLSH